MSEQYNAKCDICGKSYKVCKACQGTYLYQPWRTVVDTRSHYAIYLALTEYSNTKNKTIAREELSKCDLSERDTFNENIKIVLDEIFNDEKKADIEPKTLSKKSSTTSTKIKQDKKMIFIADCDDYI